MSALATTAQAAGAMTAGTPHRGLFARHPELFTLLLIVLVGTVVGSINQNFFQLSTVFDILRSSTVTGLFALGVLIVLSEQIGGLSSGLQDDRAIGAACALASAMLGAVAAVTVRELTATETTGAMFAAHPYNSHKACHARVVKIQATGLSPMPQAPVARNPPA